MRQLAIWRRSGFDCIELGWLLAAVLIPLTFNPWGSSAFELPKAALLRAVVLCMGLAVVVRAAEARASSSAAPDRRRIPQVVWPAIALGVAFTLATAFSVEPLVSLWGSAERQQGLLTVISYVALFSITATYLRTRAQLERLWLALVWGSLPVVVYGALQIVGLDLLAWQTDAPSPLLSTLGRANLVGSYLVLTLPLALARMLSSRRPWPYALLVAGQLLCLALSEARSAWIGVAAAGLTMGLLWAVATYRLRAVVALMAPAVAVLGCAAWLAGSAGSLEQVAQLPGLDRLAALGRLDEGSTAARLTIWQTTLPLIASRPWLGYGPETLQAVFTRVFPPQLVYYQGRQAAVDRAHNVWLDTAASSGLAGVIALGAVLGAVARAAWLRRRRDAHPAERWLWAALAGSIAGHLADLQFGFDLTATATVFWLVLAMCVTAGQDHLPDEARAPAGRTRGALIYYLPAAAIALLLVGLASVRPLMADVAHAASLDGKVPLQQRLTYGEQAARLWPIEPKYHLQLAWLYAEAGRSDAAGAELASAIQLVPDQPRVWATQGDLYARWADRDAGLYAEAEASYRRAVALAPNIAAYHAALGWVLARENRIEEGAAELERAVALDATDADAYRRLAQVYTVLGRSAEADQARLDAARWSPP